MLETGRFVSAYSAHREWATRPPDECYDSVPALHAAATRMAAASFELSTTLTSVVPIDAHTLTLALPNGSRALFSHWAFGQLCATVTAPARYLRTLPAHVTAQALNHSITCRARDSDPDRPDVLYLTRTDDDQARPQLRALTSQRYARVLNASITARVLTWLDARRSWRLPEGTWGPTGAYLSDRDMFLFLIDEERRIDDPSDPAGPGLARGLILRNSEVGAAPLTLDLFLYRYRCGNQIIWGFQHLAGVRIRHVGARVERWDGVLPAITAWFDSATDPERTVLTSALRYRLGSTREEVVSTLVEKGFTRHQATNAYALAERYETGADPRSIWGLLQGATRLAQHASHQDARYELDRLAAGLLRAAA
ncbi:MAG: hypothetical protein GEU99_23500 [Luteitalea sp.]|nr:hypothetical protein [Luteitalea sp.]